MVVSHLTLNHHLSQFVQSTCASTEGLATSYSTSHTTLHSPPLGFAFFSLLIACLFPFLWLYKILFILPISFSPEKCNQSDRAKQLRSQMLLIFLVGIEKL